MRRLAFAIAGSLLISSAPALSQETISYSYDARGRLIQVQRSGTVNNGATTAYQLDKADNRTSKAVTGAPSPLLIVPLNGPTPIPIRG